MIYAIERKDGGVSILRTVQQPDGSWPTPDECIAKWTPVRREQVKAVHEISETDLPPTRTDRRSWAFRGGKVVEAR